MLPYLCLRIIISPQYSHIEQTYQASYVYIAEYKSIPYTKVVSGDAKGVSSQEIVYNLPSVKQFYDEQHLSEQKLGDVNKWNNALGVAEGLGTAILIGSAMVVFSSAKEIRESNQ